MPIYDYRCANCGHVVEVVHGVHETGPTVCPECGGLLRKRISAPAIHFRGTGWAKKDARQASAARTGGRKADSADKEPSGSAGSSEGSGPRAGGGAARESGGKARESGGKARESGGKARESGGKASEATGSAASGDD